MWTPPTTTSLGAGRITSMKTSVSAMDVRALLPSARAARAAVLTCCGQGALRLPRIWPSPCRKSRRPRWGPPRTVATAAGSSPAERDASSARAAALGASTNTSIVPPQARPTAQALSSATPKLSRRGFPVFATSCAASITAASTQPPLTEPAIRPSALTAILAPDGARRRAPGLDHGGEGEGLRFRAPGLDFRQQITHEHSWTVETAVLRSATCSFARWRPRSSRLARLWTARKPSTWGSAACMPRARGS